MILGDNKEEKIGSWVEKEMVDIEHSFSYIASVIDLPIRVTKLTSADETLSRYHIMRWIHKQRVGSDDILVFYFSGHGGREHENSIIWPSGIIENEKRGVPIVEFSEIAKRLLSKKPSLCMVLLSCCNVFIPKDAESIRKSFSRNNYENSLDKDRVKNLFFSLHGFVMASDASPGEFSYCSIFPNSFLNSLFCELQMQTLPPSWSHIFKKAQEESTEATRNYQVSPENMRLYNPLHGFQTPQYRIYLHKKRRTPNHYKKYLFEEYRPEIKQAKSQNLEHITINDDESDIYLEEPLSNLFPLFLFLADPNNLDRTNFMKQISANSYQEGK